MGNSKLLAIAKIIVKICKQEMYDIETCSECYVNANTKKTTNWFVEICTRPHIILWAKLKGFPYWPAKAMGVNSSAHVDVRFFGDHDRAWVPIRECFLYCLADPNPPAAKYKRQSIADSLKEVDVYVNKIKSRFGSFVYAPFKHQYDPCNENEQLEMMIPTINQNLGNPTTTTTISPNKSDLTYKIYKTADNNLSIIKKNEPSPNKKDLMDTTTTTTTTTTSSADRMTIIKGGDNKNKSHKTSDKKEKEIKRQSSFEKGKKARRNTLNSIEAKPTHITLKRDSETFWNVLKLIPAKKQKRERANTISLPRTKYDDKTKSSTHCKDDDGGGALLTDDGILGKRTLSMVCNKESTDTSDVVKSNLEKINPVVRLEKNHQSLVDEYWNDAENNAKTKKSKLDSSSVGGNQIESTASENTATKELEADNAKNNNKTPSLKAIPESNKLSESMTTATENVCPPLLVAIDSSKSICSTATTSTTLRTSSDEQNVLSDEEAANPRQSQQFIKSRRFMPMPIIKKEIPETNEETDDTTNNQHQCITEIKQEMPTDDWAAMENLSDESDLSSESPNRKITNELAARVPNEDGLKSGDSLLNGSVSLSHIGNITVKDINKMTNSTMQMVASTIRPLRQNRNDDGGEGITRARTNQHQLMLQRARKSFPTSLTIKSGRSDILNVTNGFKNIASMVYIPIDGKQIINNGDSMMATTSTSVPKAIPPLTSCSQPIASIQSVSQLAAPTLLSLSSLSSSSSSSTTISYINSPGPPPLTLSSSVSNVNLLPIVSSISSIPPATQRSHFLGSYVTDNFASAVTDTIVRGGPPPLVPKPTAPLRSNGGDVFSTDAGPVSKILIDNSHKVQPENSISNNPFLLKILFVFIFSVGRFFSFCYGRHTYRSIDRAWLSRGKNKNASIRK